MIVTLQTERVRTLDQVRAFVQGSEAVDFTGADRESVCEFVRRTLVRLDYGARQVGQEAGQTLLGEGDGAVVDATDSADRHEPVGRMYPVHRSDAVLASLAARNPSVPVRVPPA